MYPKWLSGITFVISCWLFLSYLAFLIVTHIFPSTKWRFNKCKVHKLMSKINIEEKSLLNHGSTDDNA